MTAATCSCGTPTAGAPLCDRCTKTLTYAIANIPIYLDDLGTVARRQTRYGDQPATKGSPGKVQPLPVDLRFVDAGDPPETKAGDLTLIPTTQRRATLAPGNQLRWDAWHTIQAWTRNVLTGQPEVTGPACSSGCLHTSCAAVRRRRRPTRPGAGPLCHYLARNLRWILSQPWAPLMLDELTDLERRLSRFVDRRPSRWYAGRCGALTLTGHCGAELYAEDGRPTITCPTCTASHDVTARRDYLLSEAKDYLVTATEAAGALMSWTDYDGTEKNLISRISRWHDRGLIEARGTEHVGGRPRHLYRLGDLQDRLVDDAQHQQHRHLHA